MGPKDFVRSLGGRPQLSLKQTTGQNWHVPTNIKVHSLNAQTNLMFLKSVCPLPCVLLEGEAMPDSTTGLFETEVGWDRIRIDLEQASTNTRLNNKAAPAVERGNHQLHLCERGCSPNEGVKYLHLSSSALVNAVQLRQLRIALLFPIFSLRRRLWTRHGTRVGMP